MITRPNKKKNCRRSVFEIPQDVLGLIPRSEEKLAFKITQEIIIDHLPSRHKSGGDDVQIVCDEVAKHCA